ncbi:MAG: cupin domain-containing protein [Pseudonocardiales bacterium]
MTYTKDIGEISARMHLAADAEKLQIRPGGSTAVFTAPGAATEGRFGLYEWNMPAGIGSSGAHFHKTFSESFYVISGTVGLYDGQAWQRAGTGDFLYVPEGGVHAFRNDSGAPARMLILFAPAPPREEYFRELCANAAAGRTLTEQEWTELFARHDQYRAPEPAD